MYTSGTIPNSQWTPIERIKSSANAKGRTLVEQMVLQAI